MKPFSSIMEVYIGFLYFISASLHLDPLHYNGGFRQLKHSQSRQNGYGDAHRQHDHAGQPVQGNQCIHCGIYENCNQWKTDADRNQHRRTAAVQAFGKQHPHHLPVGHANRFQHGKFPPALGCGGQSGVDDVERADEEDHGGEAVADGLNGENRLFHLIEIVHASINSGGK